MNRRGGPRTSGRGTGGGGILALAGALMLAAGCGQKKAAAVSIPTATVTRRDIVSTAQATGTVEPVDTVAVKSQASGLIIAMPVDVGSQVKAGQLIAQIDTRNLNNDYQRAIAAQRAAQASLQVTRDALQRANQLYAQKVITATEHETAVVNAANAQAQLVTAQTNLNTARQNLEYATIRAQVGGTIIAKNASVGSVVSSAISTFGGGSTIVTLADLRRVRMRALVNETDVGSVHVGMPVTVTVDAFPNRQFRGQVEKVEPQAVVQQSVTMFPVLVSIDNLDQALLPGMNGEVTIITQQRLGVVAVPNDAVRGMRDAMTAAPLLGVPADSFRTALRTAHGGAGSGGRGRGAGGGTGSAGAAPAVNDSLCAAVTARVARTPGLRAQLDSLRAQARSGAVAFDSLRPRMQALYRKAGLDPATAAACMRRARRSARAAGGMGPAGAPGANGGVPGGPGGTGGPEIVFVKEGKGWAPHIVRLGASDFDYSEVLSGVREGDVVALLGAAVLQGRRDQQTQRIQTITGGGLPGTGGKKPAAAVGRGH